MDQPQPDVFQRYRRPDLVQVEREQRELAAAVAAAKSGPVLLDALERWNAARLHIDTLKQIASVRYHQDTQDPAAKGEEDFWNEASPLLRELDAVHARAVLAADTQAVASRYGQQFLRLKDCAAATFAPEIAQAIAEEARLVTQYTELCARQEVEFRGEKLNMSTIARWFVDADRATRLEAQQARDAFLARHGAELDSLYDRLVTLRDGMGRALGYDSFIPLGYKLMSRTGYGPDEVARFRDEVRREVVPVVGQILAQQAKRLGIDRVLFHDEPVGDPRGNPRPAGDARFCVDTARDMYRAMGSELGEFFDLMVERRLLDLENRPGKAGGGFCTIFAEAGVPFVFANFNGTDGDVRVLTHECGHAFQAWRSRHQPLLEYRFPTYEACEIHSMSMEYLASPWYGRFFGGDDEAIRYKRVHLEQELLSLPYMAAVDHFQHEVYANPRMTPAERQATWRRMEELYLPYRDYGGLLPYLARGTHWQRQLHIYVMPFYYIDYALAQTCALQMWKRSEEDRPAALRDYLALCEVGGSLSFEEIARVGNLTSPFQPGCLKGVVAAARRALEL